VLHKKKIIALILGACLLAGCTGGSHYVQFGGYAQGGVWSVKANVKGVKARPAEIQKGIEAILEEIDTTLSGYNKRSQLSRYNAGEPVQLSPMFLEVQQAADKFKEETGGALNCAAGPLYDIWGFGFKTDSLPSDELVRQTLADCGKKLNFNAIAQGYSCDKVAAYLYSLGIKDMLVDIGEIFCDGLNPSGKPWRVGIDKPEDGNNSPGAKMEGIWESNGGPQGVVTSGNYRKFYIKDGVKYSHTIDPRTGYPVQHKLLSATVIAPTAMAADAYATYCMVIGTEKAQEFILSRPDLEACLISEEIWTSPGFKLQ
jgi:thiamine biosynthesis lipoprotein